MSKMDCIIKRPDEAVGHRTSISCTLENLQKTVGGHVETVTIGAVDVDGEEVNLVILCDEEGRLKGEEYNCEIYGISFVGTIVAIGAKGEEFADIPISFTDWKVLVS